MKSKPFYCSQARIGIWIAVFLFTTFNLNNVDAEDTHSKQDTSILASPLTLYQATVSKADGQRCPMYPSCSHYAAQAVERHGKILGWLLTGDRLLRCGHDETRRVPKVMVNGNQRAYDPLEANTFWWGDP
jgi:putative component of membrane protein insertase Oxa1/YidC/SpoIIIJ protein YidD